MGLCFIVACVCVCERPEIKKVHETLMKSLEVSCLVRCCLKIYATLVRNSCEAEISRKTRLDGDFVKLKQICAA